ncbi:MAG: alpha/beta hydrolase [Bacteroidales bacterium]|nr:alpha/beta hydrolase [Bacteroidales bacterium]
MKKSLLSFVLFLIMIQTSLFAQQTIEGSWTGKLSFSGQSLRMVIHLKFNDQNELTSTLDSPDQGAFGIKVQSASFTGDSLTLILPPLMAGYAGKLVHTDSIQGVWKQAGLSFTLNLNRTEEKEIRLRRPQDPSENVSYLNTEVRFYHPSGMALAGTLSMPQGKGPFPAVVLVSGSGPQNRDEELMGHKPFLVMADFLVKQGIVVLRYDDRGVGASDGVFSKATTLDFAEDATAALMFLRAQKHVDSNRCGLIGHSEGGLIAPIVASKMHEVSFIVLLAAPGIPSDELMLRQGQLIAEAQGASPDEIRLTQKSNKAIFQILKEGDDQESSRKRIQVIMHELGDSLTVGHPGQKEALQKQLDAGIEQLFSPWFQQFIRFDPSVYLQKVFCPVLAINGSKDRQVPADVNLAAIDSLVRTNGNTQVSTRKIEGLNHLFQTAETGSPAEYATIEETFAPVALEVISSWILSLPQAEGKPNR